MTTANHMPWCIQCGAMRKEDCKCPSDLVTWAKTLGDRVTECNVPGCEHPGHKVTESPSDRVLPHTPDCVCDECVPHLVIKSRSDPATECPIHYCNQCNGTTAMPALVCVHCGARFADDRVFASRAEVRRYERSKSRSDDVSRAVSTVCNCSMCQRIRSLSKLPSD